jgi:thiol:disulfide interchange protein DsbD
LLTFVASSQNVWLGAFLLFLYALGMGLPFVLIGAFAVHLPRAGAWMEWVKSALGVLLLGLAFTYARDAFPAARMLSGGVAVLLGRWPGALLAAALAAVGVAWGALHLSFSRGWVERVAKGAGVALLVAALVLRLATLDAPNEGQLWVDWGLQTPRTPASLSWHLRFGAPGDGLERFESALAQARAQGRPVLIDFFADWCAACKELDRETYVAPEVVQEGRRFFTIKVDGTNEAQAVQALYERFGVQGLPTVAFVSSQGRVLQSPRVTGFLEPAPFLAELRKVQ